MREGRKRLTIGADLQIYFAEDGKAWYSSKSGRPPEAVEPEVQSWQEFVTEWLEAFQVPRPRRYSEYEHKVLNSLAKIRHQASRALRSRYPAAELEARVREVVEASAQVLTADTDIAPQSLVKSCWTFWGLDPDRRTV